MLPFWQALYPVCYHIVIIIKAYLAHADMAAYKMKIGFIHDRARSVDWRIIEMVMGFIRLAFGLDDLHTCGIKRCYHVGLLATWR